MAQMDPSSTRGSSCPPCLPSLQPCCSRWRHSFMPSPRLLVGVLLAPKPTRRVHRAVCAGTARRAQFCRVPPNAPPGTRVPAGGEPDAAEPAGPLPKSHPAGHRHHLRASGGHAVQRPTVPKIRPARPPAAHRGTTPLAAPVPRRSRSRLDSADPTRIRRDGPTPGRGPGRVSGGPDPRASVRSPRTTVATTLLGTDPDVSAAQIAKWCCHRGQIAVTCPAVRVHLHGHTRRQGTDLAIARTTPTRRGRCSGVARAA